VKIQDKLWRLYIGLLDDDGHPNRIVSRVYDIITRNKQHFSMYQNHNAAALDFIDTVG
jgi:hypothetical protein